MRRSIDFESLIPLKKKSNSEHAAARRGLL